MSGQYDPRNAAYAIRDMIRRNTPEIVSSNVPGLVNAQGKELAKPSKPERPPVEGVVIPIKALEDGVDLPADFADVPRTRGGLKAHVRPDGGVCLGFYGSGPEDAVVVYGDPLMSTSQTKQIVVSYWQQRREVVS